MESKAQRGRFLRFAGRAGALLFACLLGGGLAFPDAGRAASSGPGVWDVMIYGNYDLVSPNSGGTLSNAPSSLASPAWNKFFNDNGYGGGVGVAYWLNDVWAVRAMAQTSLFATPSSYGGGSTQSSALTGGLEAKLFGDAEYYLYAVLDAGGAFEANMPGQGFFGKTTASSWTAYADVGLGFNLSWVFLEAKLATLPQALAGGVSGGYGQNPFWYVPLTAGFNF